MFPVSNRVETLEARVLLGAHLIKQVDPEQPHGDAVAVLDGVAYFTATDGVRGPELWRSDGTPAGTWMVKDISPTPSGSLPIDPVVWNGALYFAGASDGIADIELWTSDGTAQGTHIVKDISPGIGGSIPAGFTDVNGLLCFGTVSTQNAAPNKELWRTDGTSSGTSRLVAFNGDMGALSPEMLGKSFFVVATNHISGNQLWVTDGTAAGTSLVHEFASIASSTFLGDDFAFYQGAVYFPGNDGSGWKLWRSDGTAAGTMVVAAVGSINGPLHSFQVYQDRLYFAAPINPYSQLWSYDGASPTLVRETNAISELTLFDGLLYFVGADPAHGRELWVTDGSTAGTQRVTDINPGAADGVLHTLIVPTGGKLYFEGNDGQSGRELWSSDGSAGGTTLVRDIAPGLENSFPKFMGSVGNALLFSARTSGTRSDFWIVDALAQLYGSTLKIAGDDSADIISIDASIDTIMATVNGVDYTFPAAQVRRIVVEGYSGADLIELDGALALAAMTVNGGGGNDLIKATVDGSLESLTGALSLDGGDGADSILFDDHLHPAAQSYLLSPDSFNTTGDGAAVFFHDNFEQVTVLAGSAGDRVSIAPSVSCAFEVHAGAGALVDRLDLDTFGVSGATLTNTGGGSAQFEFTNRQPVTIIGFEQTQQLVAPRLSDAQFAFDAPLPQLRFQFDTGIQSLAAAGVALVNLDTGAVLNLPGPHYEPATRTATFSFAPAQLPDGAYRAIVKAGWAVDPLGAATTSAHVLDFFTLAGDANRDRTVDIIDLGILATNWQQSPRKFSQGDFNYDGAVDITDLGILATNWQVNLPPPSGTARANTRPAAKAGGLGALGPMGLSDKRIVDSGRLIESLNELVSST